MTSGRAARSLWTVATGLTFAATTTLMSLAVTPMLLRWLGTERFGLQRTLVDGVAYLGLFELGLLGATRANLALQYGAGNRAGAASYVRAALRGYVPVVALMACAGAAVWLAAPWFVTTRDVSSGEIRLALAIFLGAAFLAPLSVYRAVLEAQQRAYVLKAIGIGNVIGSLALGAVFAWSGWGLPGQALAVLLAQAGMAVAIMLTARRGLVPSRGALPDGASAGLRRLSRQTFAYEISSRVALLSDNIIIATMISPQAVAAFFLTQRVAMLVLAQLQEIGNATWAALIELHARGERHAFRDRLLQLSNSVSSAAIILLVPVAMLNRSFITLWVGDEKYAGAVVSILVCINVWMWAVSSLWGWATFGAGQIGRWTPYGVAFGIVNVIVSIAATRWIGLAGPLVGTAAAFAVVSSWAMPAVVAETFAIRRHDLYAAVVRPFAWGIPYAAAIWVVTQVAPPTTWLLLVGTAAVSALLGALCWWFVGLKRADRVIWVAQTRSAIATVV